MQPNSSTRTTRLAPSPTGALHLGNARTFLLTWAIARQAGWRIVMRIEDLDGPRVKPGAAAQAEDDLRWLGLDWDEHAGNQTDNLTPYHQALEQLRAMRLIYPCHCTRKEIEAAQSAPHGDEHELRYPGSCRPSETAALADSVQMAADADAAWRLMVPDEPVVFHDELQGPQSVNVQQQVGDFVVATKAGLPAYQLAVMVDDARQGITDVIRGDDLLSSTARQLWLWRMLEPQMPRPRWWHLPLVYGQDGRRLAKRHGDTRLATYRETGASPQRVIGLLARWSGVTESREPMSAAEFVGRFSVDQLPPAPVTFTAEDHLWLLQ